MGESQASNQDACPTITTVKFVGDPKPSRKDTGRFLVPIVKHLCRRRREKYRQRNEQRTISLRLKHVQTPSNAFLRDIAPEILDDTLVNRRINHRLLILSVIEWKKWHWSFHRFGRLHYARSMASNPEPVRSIFLNPHELPLGH